MDTKDLKDLDDFFGGSFKFPAEAERKLYEGSNGTAAYDVCSFEEAKPSWDAREYDIVEKPKHYMLFEKEGIEVRDVLDKLAQKMWNNNIPIDEDKLPMFLCDYIQMMQYFMRFMEKNGLEDLEKGRWYLDKMIGAYE